MFICGVTFLKTVRKADELFYNSSLVLIWFAEKGRGLTITLAGISPYARTFWHGLHSLATLSLALFSRRKTHEY